MSRAFPAGFLWGCATAAHQVEGGNFQNDWWRFEEQGGIVTGDSSGVAIDHWHRFRDDFRLLHELRNNAHRLSIEWSRVEPEPGRFDARAVAHYREVLQELRRLGMTPMVTLLHFSSPGWFVDRGGWEASGAADGWLPFVRHVAHELGDLVDLWCTINEPNIMGFEGWIAGEFPPGRKGDVRGLYRVLHNLREAHERAYRELHRITPSVPVGLAHNRWLLFPERLTVPDRLVAGVSREVMDRWPASPWRWTRVFDAPADFCGLNHYSGSLVRFDPRRPEEGFTSRHNPVGLPENDFGWAVNPHWMLLALRELKGCGKPVYVTESGISAADDRVREAYLPAVLGAVWQAIAEGVPVRGYFHWTSVDNFEWAQGYAQRFGLISFDAQTQEREVKPSGRLFAEIAEHNALPDPSAD
ncbi:MAG: family 1 glycosylhydrolase [Candidatus Dormiibacterota bacterium]